MRFELELSRERRWMCVVELAQFTVCLNDDGWLYAVVESSVWTADVCMAL